MKAVLPLLAVSLLVLASLAAVAQDPQAPAPGDAGSSADAARPTQTVTLYGHIFGNGLGSPMPANTVPPTGDNLYAIWTNDNCGLLPADDPTGQVGVGGSDCDKDPFDKLAVFLTAGPVQVHSSDDFNYTSLHNEHGRAKEVFLDKTKDIHAWFYGAADFHSWTLLCPAIQPPIPPDVACPWPSWGWDPGILPNFVVEAKLYMASLGDYGQGASDPPPIANAIAGAKVIAQGKIGPVNLQTGIPGSPNAQEFDINLGKPTVDVIPKDQDIFVVYQWYEEMPTGKVSLQNFKPWAGEQFPVRFTLPVKNPFDVELVVPQFVHGKVLVHGVMSVPWGSYDVDLKSVTLDIRDPTGQPVQLDHLTRSGDYSVAHGAHFKPVNVTWVWDYQADKARAGTYKATVRGCDLQRICSATEGSFTINPDGSPGTFTVGRSGQQTASEGQLKAITGAAGTNGNATAGSVSARTVPGVEPLAFGLLLGAVALLVRRRRDA